MREYVVRHLTDSDVWSSITIPAFSTHAVVVTSDGSVADISIESANELIRYCGMRRMYTVEEVQEGVTYARA